MRTLVETVRPPVLCEVVTLEESDAPQWRHPFDLVASAVAAFQRDAIYFGMNPSHVEGWNVGPNFYLEAWK